MVPRVPWNPSFMKVLIILYYDKLTRSVGPVDYNSPNGTLYLMSSKIILTYKYFGANSGRLEPNRLLKTRHFRLRVGVTNVKMGVAKKNRARFARVLYTQNPPLQNPKSATVTGMSYSGKSLLKASLKRFTSLRQLLLTMMEFGSNPDTK